MVAVKTPPPSPTFPPLYVGIDPGLSGGIATLFNGKATVEPMPGTEADLWHLIKSLANVYAGSARYVMIEQVTGYVGGGGNTGSSQFKFGTNYGLCRMACIAAGMRLEAAGSNKWQRALGIPVRRNVKGSVRSRDDKKDHPWTTISKETKGAYKKRLKGFAQQLFPGVEGITLKTCDALLLAEYNRRRKEGEV